MEKNFGNLLNTNSQDSRINVLIITTWYPSKQNPIKGIFVREYAKAIQLFANVVVVHPCGRIKLHKGFYHIDDAVEEGIRTIRVWHRKTPLFHPYFDKLALCKTYDYLLENGFKADIIHAQVYLAGYQAVQLGKRYEIPVVISEHATAFVRKSLNRKNIRKARIAMKNAKFVLPVSKDLENHIYSYGISGNFKVVPNVVDINLFLPSDKVGIKVNRLKKILTVCLLSSKKGIHYLLNAVAKLKSQRNDFVLDIVGDGPELRELQNLTKILSIEEVVVFHGSKMKNEVAQFMNNCDFFVLPSLFETFGVVLIEAMASGKPVLATKVGGIPEFVNNTNGYLVSPANVEELTNALNRMLDHFQEFDSEQIIRQVKENYSYQAIGKRFNDIYREVLKL